MLNTTQFTTCEKLHKNTSTAVKLSNVNILQQHFSTPLVNVCWDCFLCKRYYIFVCCLLTVVTAGT